MRRPDDIEPEEEEEFVFDLDSDEPLEVAPIEPAPLDPADSKSPFVPEDPELEWVARWRRNQKKRKGG